MDTLILGNVRILILLYSAGLFFIFASRLNKGSLDGSRLFGLGFALVFLNMLGSAMLQGTLLTGDLKERWLPMLGVASGYVGQTFGLVFLLVGTHRLVRYLGPHLEAHYPNLVERALVGVYLIQDGVLKFVNPRFAEICGYDRQEVLGMPIGKLIAPPSAVGVVEGTQQGAMAPSQTTVYQAKGIRKDGQAIDLEVYGSRTLYQGKLAIHGTVIDLSERRQAERALRDSEERYRALYDDNPSMYFTVDAIGTVLSVNKFGAEQLGYEACELVGESVFEVVYEEDRKGMQRQLDECINWPSRTHHWELRKIRKDGRTLWAKEVARAVRHHNGEPVVLIVCEDISERKRAEEALRKSEKRYRTLVERIPDGVYRRTPDGSFVEINPAMATMLGYESSDALAEIDANLQPYFQPADRKGPAESLPSSGGERIRTFSHRREDGREVWLEDHCREILDDKGNLIYYEGIVREITERKRAEDERRKFEARIQQAQKLESLGILAGGIAHDFNNLLVGIMGNASLAVLELPPDSPVRYTIDQIQIAGQRAADLANQMLAYSGKGHFAVHPMDLNAVIDETVHLLQASIAKNVDIKFNFESTLPAVEGDATQIRQVVMNLVVNASEAIGDQNGEITVRTGSRQISRNELAGYYTGSDLPEGRYVFLDVSDTGCGMDSETLSKIFDPFFTTKFTGRGLGLAAVLGIVRGHLGAIKVASTPQWGSVFTILLPAVDVPAEASSGAIRATSATASFHGEGLVLVIDDEPTVRNVAARLLRQWGFTPMQAADGRSGLEMFSERAAEIACVLLDLTMPHPNGEKVFLDIHRLRADTPVILMSGYHEKEVKRRFLNKGLAAFLQKPFTADQLAGVLSSVMAKG